MDKVVRILEAVARVASLLVGFVKALVAGKPDDGEKRPEA